MRGYLILLIALLMWTGVAEAQQQRRIKGVREAYAAPEEMVSFTASTPFSQVVAIINDFSKRYFGKIIVDPEQRDMPIGLDIPKAHWLTGMETILKAHQLWYSENEEYLQIYAVGDDVSSLSKEEQDKLADFRKREVIISAVFFEADAAKLRQAGTSWNIFRNGDNLDANARNLSADNNGGLFELEINPKVDWGDVTAIFKALESDQIGEVIARPQVTVRSGDRGRIQVGSDISVTLQDFAGNAVTQFYSTGSIVEVKPLVSRYDSINYVYLDLKIERSSSSAGEVGLEIKKSQAQTGIYLLDGEETVIGGLYINEESSKREGVPFLKDLPWWFFGARYLFGYESDNVIKKELLIMIKAELLPSLEDRFHQKVAVEHKQRLLEERRRRQLEMKYLEMQSEKSANE